MSSYYITNKKISNIDEINYYGKHYGQTLLREKFGSFNIVYNYSKYCEANPGLFFRDDVACIYIGHFFNLNSNDLIDLYLEQGSNFIKNIDGEFSLAIIDLNKDLISCSSDTFFCRPIFLAKDEDKIGIASLESFLKQHNFKNILKKQKNVFYDIKNEIKKTTITEFDNTEKKDSFNDWYQAFENSINKRIIAKPNPLVCMSEGNDSGSISCYLNRHNIKHGLFSYIYPNSFTRDVIHQRHGMIPDLKIQKPCKSFIVPKLSDKKLNNLIKAYKNICGDYEAEYLLDSDIYVKGEEKPYGERPLELKSLKVDVRYTLGFYYSQYMHSILKDNFSCWLTGSVADFVGNKYLNIYFGKYNTVDLIDVPEETYYNIAFTGRETLFVYCDKFLFQEYLWLKKDTYKYNKQPHLDYCIKHNYPVRKEFLENKPYRPLGFSLHNIDERFIDNCYLQDKNLTNVVK
jgi:hypothetical protein